MRGHHGGGGALIDGEVFITARLVWRRGGTEMLQGTKEQQAPDRVALLSGDNFVMRQIWLLYNSVRIPRWSE